MKAPSNLTNQISHNFSPIRQPVVSNHLTTGTSVGLALDDKKI
jgi:hypothetical protein